MKTIFIFLFFSISASAQINLNSDFKAPELGKPFSQVKSEIKRTYKNDKGEILFLKFRSKGLNVQKYDPKSMALISDKYIKIYKAAKSIQKVFFIDDRLFLLIARKNVKSTTFYRQEIYFSSGDAGKEEFIFSTIGGTLSTAGRADLNVNGAFGFNKLPTKFAIFQSADSSKILIAYRSKSFKKNVGYHVLDNKLRLLWGYESARKPEEPQLQPRCWMITNNGKVYFSLYDGKARALLLYECQKDGRLITSTLKQNIVNNGGHHMQELRDGSICYSFFTNSRGFDLYRNTYEYLDNSLLYVIVESTGVVKEHIVKIPLGVLNQSVRKSTKKRNEKAHAKGKTYGVSSLGVQHILEQVNGDLLVVGEDYRAYGDYPDYSYVHKSMMVLSVTRSGELNWVNKICKFQSAGSGKHGIGYGLFSRKNNLYVFYIDNIKNVLDPPMYLPKMYRGEYKKGVLSYAKINIKTGGMVRHNVFELKSVAGTKAEYINIPHPVELDKKTILLEIYTGKRFDNVLKLTLKD